MQFVKREWKLLFAYIIFIQIFDLGLSTRIEMNAGDIKICLGCLNIIKILRNVKSSSICERISQTSFKAAVGVDLNGLPQNELMCYEIYYYFYYFKPNYLSELDLNTPESYMEMLGNTAVNNSEQSDCNVCAYLDKCEYYGCANQLAIEGKEMKYNKRIHNSEDMEVTLNRDNKTEMIEPRNEIDLLKSQQKSMKNIDLDSGTNFNMYSNMVNENKTGNFIKENYSVGREPMNKTDISFLSKSVTSIKPGENTSNINSRQNIERINILYEHVDLARVKIEHMLDEVCNLAKIHQSIQEIKKKAINNLISMKMQRKLPSDIEMVPLRIVNQDNLRNYLNDIQIISEKFKTIFDATQSEIRHNLNKYFLEIDANNSNSTNSKTLDTSMEYLLSFVNCYNELYLLGNTIYQSNIKIVDTIQKLFPHKEGVVLQGTKNKLDFENHKGSVSLEINKLENPKINEDEKNFIEKNETEHTIANKIEKRIQLIAQNRTKVYDVIGQKTKYSNKDKLNESEAEKIKNGNDVRVLLTNSSNKIEDVKLSNSTKFKNSTGNSKVEMKNNTVTLSEELKIKSNETNYLIERLQKLEKEQERFNLFLKNSSLLDAYNGKLHQAISKKEKVDEEIAEENDEALVDEKANEESSENLKESYSNLHKNPTRQFINLPHTDDYSKMKKAKTEIVKNHYSLPKPDNITNDDEINTIDLTNNVIGNPVERKPYARKFIRKIKSRKF